MDNGVSQASVPPHTVSQSGVTKPTAQSSTVKIVSLVIVIVAAVIVIIAVVIALGISLSTGLSNKNANSPGTTATTTAVIITTTATAVITTTTASTLTAPSPNGTFSILAPPTISCTYNPSTCGCSAIQPWFATPRIFQGYPARANSWPWMVKLSMTVNGETFDCGGFLISYRHVVTAAHCIISGLTPNGIIVRVGIQNVSDENAGQTLGVATITVHPNYDTETFVNDIAILTLASTVNQTTTVGLCCVSYNTTLPMVGEHGVVAGWGYIIENGPESDDLLQAVVLVHDPSEICAINSTKIQFCAGYNGTDVCQGDSGGPFMTVVNNAWTCVGLVSNGPSCHQDTAYTRIAAYQQFITNVISS